jgi:phosphoribosylformimino-5-aminoimidazole carboxamide ribotide isomerase
MEDATIFSDDPTAQAQAFVESGCQWLHIVDLNGAFAGEPINKEIVHTICREVKGLEIQLGGGIRNLDTIGMWLMTGIRRVILGTIAVQDPDIVHQACKEYPGRIAVGIDTKDGMVATDGWAKASDIRGGDLARKFADSGCSAIIHTDINRDGLMGGPNLRASLELAQEVDIPIIVSGGVSCLDDLHNIKANQAHGLGGAIVGRAIYEGMNVAAAREILES